jgi:uncharacterized phage protein gp47/JayE
MANIYLQSPSQDYVASLNYTTNRALLSLNGSFDGNISSFRVIVRGVYDPDVQDELIDATDTTFTLPNLALSEGIELVAGINEIKVEGYNDDSNLVATAIANIELAVASDFNQELTPPTGLSAEQFSDYVVINVEGLSSSNVIGYNLYCSEIQGGGVEGYRQINVLPIRDGATKENVSEYATLETDFLAEDADPLRLRVKGTQINSINEALVVNFDEAVPISEEITKLRAEVKISTLSISKTFSFKHVRTATTTSIPATIPSARFSTVANSEPLFYVATAIYYNPVSGSEVESSLSSEISAKPILLNTTLPTIPVVGRQQILEDAVLGIYRNSPQASVSPGSAIRDLFLDPFASEAERIRFVVDYVYRSASFSTLLAIDDPAFSGTSVSVDSSSYKSLMRQALFLPSNDSVQNIIDLSFDRLASNFGVTRNQGTAARGEVIFFTRTQPTADLRIPLGTIVSSGSVEFRTTTQGFIPLNGFASYYNPINNRYEVTIPIKASSTGAISNVTAGEISSIISDIRGLEVTNTAETYGGLDLESNLALSIRAQQAISSIDTGTTQGYYSLISNAPNVISASVVSAGDPLMNRDVDPATGLHSGGKVDIWVQGEQDTYVTDSFAFTFDVKEKVVFDLVGSLTFRASDNDLSVNNPIVNMLDFSALNLGLVNATTGARFDLTDVEIISYNTIRLSSSVTQPAFSLTDIILGDFRLRTGTTHTFTRQPVKEISSLTGEVSGQVGLLSYYLNHPNNILDLGGSTKSGDEIVIEDVRGELSALPIVVEGESHVILEKFTEPLNKLGTNPFSLRVFNEDRSVEYYGPYSGQVDLDYITIEGGSTTPYGIQRTDGSRISSGQTVLFDYSHAENFSVRYRTNLILSTLQSMVEKKKHATADVLINEAFEVELDISAVVVLSSGSSSAFVDSDIRSNLSALVGSLRMGDPLRVSDIVNAMDKTNGVSYVQLPLSKMTLSVGSQIVREAVAVGLGGAVIMPSLSTPSVKVWLVGDSLDFIPEENGGEQGSYRGVFKDTDRMVLAPSISLLSNYSNQAYIIGSEGAVIQGYTDDLTLNPTGGLSDAEILAERKRLTASKVLISLLTGDNPSEYSYAVTYTIGLSPNEARDISVSDTQFITLGLVNITYEQDQVRSRINTTGVR